MTHTPDLKAAQVVIAWLNMRDFCEHYTGIKDDDASYQCKCPGNNYSGSWCAMDVCPRLQEEARKKSAGWD